MKLRSLFLADYATVRGNLVTVVGGGITRIGAPEYPIPIVATLVAMVDIGPSEEIEHTFALDVKKKGARRLTARVEGTFGLNRDAAAPADATLIANLVVDLRPLVIPTAGTFRITLFVDERRLGVVTLVAEPSTIAGAHSTFVPRPTT